MLALITGASSGIGWELAKRLDREGISLILTGRSKERLQELQSLLSKKTQIIIADLQTKQGRDKVVEIIWKKQPDLVVNNAGVGLYGSALEHTVEEQLQLMELNGNALMQLTLEAGQMLYCGKKEGTIMNISSAAAFQPFPYFAAYAASKAFVNALSESLDAEWSDQGIRVLAACPGVVKTRFRSRAGGREMNDYKMEASFAADQIWKQIVSEKTVRIFDWKYRVAIFLGRWLVPKALTTYLLKSQMRSIVK